MKESTFSLLMAIALVLIAEFDGDPIRSIIGFILAAGFLYTSTICRAMERNGVER